MAAMMMTGTCDRIRPLEAHDATAALALYTELTFGPACTDIDAFDAVIAHPGTTVFGRFCKTDLIAMVTLHLLPNVTWGARPYAVIENVITTARLRKRGIGRQLMDHTLTRAWQAGAYKVMLMTGQKRTAAGFYQAMGFSAEDKTAMVIRRP